MKVKHEGPTGYGREGKEVLFNIEGTLRNPFSQDLPLVLPTCLLSHPSIAYHRPIARRVSFIMSLRLFLVKANKLE